MTFTARFKVQDVSDGPRPIDVLAVAQVDDGTLTQNTEHATSMELHLVINEDSTRVKVGDTIQVTGHFDGSPSQPVVDGEQAQADMVDAFRGSAGQPAVTQSLGEPERTQD